MPRRLLTLSKEDQQREGFVGKLSNESNSVGSSELTGHSAGKNEGDV